MAKLCSMIVLVAALFGPAAELLGAPDYWDPRLDNICDLYLEDVSGSVPDGNYYWRLVSAVFEDESEAGGTHHIYYKCLDANGDPIEGEKTWASWSYTNETDFVYQFTKGAIDGYWANFAMYGNCPENGCGWPYNAWIDTTDGPSDKVWGMGLTNPPDGTLCNAHVSFRLTWQWTQKSGGGGSPTISLDPTSLTPSTQEGSSPDPDTFTVTNTGAGTLNYSITDNANWLSVDPDSGTSTGEADTITVNYSTASLSAGNYNATITVSDPNATNDPQTVAVTLTVTEGAPPGQNLLSNADFEGGFYNDPDIDHQSGNSWHRFALSGVSKAGGYYSPSNHSPNWAQTIYESSWVAGIYQQVDVTSGHTYGGSVWVKGTNSEVKFWVGIDPAGGTDASAGGIVWSSQAAPGDTWTQIDVEADATASTVTLFLKAQNTQPYNLYAYFDDAELSDQGGGPPPATGTIAGTVKDDGGSPINGATVQTTTGGYSTTSNESGEYTLSNVAVGTYTVVASKAGYESDTETGVQVFEDQTTTVNFTLVEEEEPFEGLENGNFEGGFYNDPDVDHKVANSWTKFILSGSPKHGGHWSPENHSPNWAQVFYESNWVGGIYQQVSGTSSGNNYTASVWVKGNDHVRFWIGIDPLGGTDASSGNVQWSSQAVPGGTWTQISKQVQASASTITVFLKAQNPQPYNEYGYFDDAEATTP